MKKPTFEKIVEEIFVPRFDCEIELLYGDNELCVDTATRAIDWHIRAAQDELAEKYPDINMKGALFSNVSGLIIMFITIAIDNMPYYYSARWDISSEDRTTHDKLKQYKPKN